MVQQKGAMRPTNGKKRDEIIQYFVGQFIYLYIGHLIFQKFKVIHISYK